MRNPEQNQDKGTPKRAPENRSRGWSNHCRSRPTPPLGWRRPSGHGDIHSKQRTLFKRFFGFLLFLALPLVGLGILLGAVIGSADNAPPRFHMGIAFICGLPALFFILVFSIGAVAFRNLGTPLAKIMAAADAVASGDLTTRVEEQGAREFRRMAASFNRMTEELEHADKQRRNLTADIAHELRTPLHILQGNLEGLQDGVYEPTPDHVSAMLDETHMLTHLVDDLQTLSLVEAGQLPFQMETVDVNELLADVSTSFSGPIEAAGLTLITNSPEDSEILQVIGDVERLNQVLSNLMGNALHHTPAGGEIYLCAASIANGAQISVRDTGEGIPPEDLPFIFDRFWRGDKSRQRQRGTGSGLGLAIVKQFVQAHGGEINVESELGKGTTFVIDLPN